MTHELRVYRLVDGPAERVFDEEQDGRTLVTIAQSGFERRDDRDGIESGWPSILEALQGVVVGSAAK